MNVFNDRKPGTLATWVDDSGKLRYLTVVQDTGNPIKFYYDGIAVQLVPIEPNGMTISEVEEQWVLAAARSGE